MRTIIAKVLYGVLSVLAFLWFLLALAAGVLALPFSVSLGPTYIFAWILTMVVFWIPSCVCVAIGRRVYVKSVPRFHELLNEECILRMIREGEKRTWDFKAREVFPYFRSGLPQDVQAKNQTEFVRDVASFANTERGGYLIFGVKDVRTVENQQSFDPLEVLQEFSISDEQKERAETLIRHRVNPVPTVEVSVVRVLAHAVTIFSVTEGKGDLCDVDGVTYVRGVAGRRVAQPSEKSQILERRSTKRLRRF